MMVGGPIFSWRFWPCFQLALTGGAPSQSVNLLTVNNSDNTRILRVTSTGTMTTIDRIVAREALGAQVVIGNCGPASQADIAFGNAMPGLLYFDGGALKFRGSAGTITTIGRS